MLLLGVWPLQERLRLLSMSDVMIETKHMSEVRRPPPLVDLACSRALMRTDNTHPPEYNLYYILKGRHPCSQALEVICIMAVEIAQGARWWMLAPSLR